MDKLARAMMGTITESLTKGVICDDREFRQNTGEFPKGVGHWVFHPTKSKSTIAESFAKTGDYASVLAEAKTWARGKGLTTIYLVKEYDELPGTQEVL